MSENKNGGKVPVELQYKKENLLKPAKLVVNYGERHALQLNGGEYSKTYEELLKEARKVLKAALYVRSSSEVTQYPDDDWDKIRDTRGIELSFRFPVEADALLGFLDIAASTDIKAKSIDEIVITPSSGSVYLLDSGRKAYYKYKFGSIDTNLDYILSSTEKSSSISCLFLDRYSPEFYGRGVIVPVQSSFSELPVLSGETEVIPHDNIPESIASFFDDDISTLSVIKNTDGTTIYTDREDQFVKISPSGLLDYVKYNITVSGAQTVQLRDVIDISTQFINQHFGFPQDSYISEIIRSIQDNRYIIRYKYRYQGIPVISDSSISTDSIEIEIVGNEVKRYKRMVRTITGELETKPVRNFINVLDILLDKKVSSLSGESIVKINDLYLAYYETNLQSKITYIPVWVADVNVEKTENETKMNQRRLYIVNAETGVILDK